MNASWRTLLSRTFPLPFGERLEEAVRRFSPAERALFFLFSSLLVGSTLVVLYELNRLITIEVPARGGALVEGVVGTPRFVNPLLALSDADRDLTALIYAGLLAPSPDGTLVPALAERYEISEDGLAYTFTIREDAVFHDGNSVTADDVIFTIQKAQDPALKSPKRANWEGVAAEKLDERTVRFVLKQPYAPFLENATIGILPRHIWKDADAEQFPFSPFNVEPVGAGPYRLVAITRNASGIPLSYELKPFRRFSRGEPFLAHLTLRFYANEDALIAALKAREIQAANGISPARAAPLAESGLRVAHAPLPRIFAVFFNQNQAPLFAAKEVREALAEGTDKGRIVAEVLSGYGVPLAGPIPPGFLAGEEIPSGSPEEMIAILEKAGWKRGEDGVFEKKKSRTETLRLAFSLATSNAPELKAAGAILKELWEAGGAAVDLKLFETSDLNQNVIRPRKYDALLFGEIVGRELDLFAFWHSSQRNDPGLNVALYANITTDRLLERARALSDRSGRLKLYEEFLAEIEKDAPAVFLYAPDFIYLLPEKVRGVRLGPLATPSERFANVAEWYVETDRVWTFFNRS